MISSTHIAPGARQILDAAAEMFAREDYEAVSVSAIASHAGVSKANVFHHFASKEELFLAVMRAIATPHAEFVEALLAEDISSLEKLRRLVHFDVRNAFDNPQPMRLVFKHLGDGGHCPGRPLAQQVFFRNIGAIIALFEQGQARGEFRADVAPRVAAMLLGGFCQLLLRCATTVDAVSSGQGEASPERMAEDAFKLLAAGVSAAGADERSHSRAQAAPVHGIQ